MIEVVNRVVDRLHSHFLVEQLLHFPLHLSVVHVDGGLQIHHCTHSSLHHQLNVSFCLRVGSDEDVVREDALELHVGNEVDIETTDTPVDGSHFTRDEIRSHCGGELRISQFLSEFRHVELPSGLSLPDALASGGSENAVFIFDLSFVSVEQSTVDPQIREQVDASV